MKKVAILSAGFLAIAIGVVSFLKLNLPAAVEHALVLPEARELPEFRLTDSNNQQFNKAAISGKWSLLFFGYTNCPDVCPTELYTLANAIKIMEKNKATIPQVTFVSLDPVRDTTEKLKEYTRHFHPSFIGVTGKQSELDMFAVKFGVIHEKVYEKDGKYITIVNNEIPDEAKDKYLVNHSARIMIVNPKGQLYGIFPNPNTPEKISADMSVIQG